MAKFLNTTQLNEWIPKLISQSQRELIIIVPYIKISQGIYDELLKANERGVETTIVCRENKLTDTEKAKFDAIDNLNLMYHLNVHCKCYYNENYLIISSMNMYEYSEKNNREMGILLHREDLAGEYLSRDNVDLFKDALKEINEIIKGAELIKYSRETITEGFEMDILKSDKEKQEELAKKLNKIFVHKKFEATELKGDWVCRCTNYFDKINVSINRIVEVQFDLPEEKIKEIYDSIPKHFEFQIAAFKLYWNYHKKPLYLYPDSRHQDWKKEQAKEDEYKLMKRGIDELIGWLRKYMKPL